MELTRQHAKEAVRMVKREQPGARHTDSEIVDMCTNLALGLQHGKVPERYRKNTVKVTSRKSRGNTDHSHSNSSSSQLGVTSLTRAGSSEVAGDVQDYIKEEASEVQASIKEDASEVQASIKEEASEVQASIKEDASEVQDSVSDVSSSRSGASTPSSRSRTLDSGRSSRTTPDSLGRRASSSSEISVIPSRSRSLTPSPRGPRIPSSGPITTWTPAPSSELPSIDTTFRHALTGLGSRKMQPKPTSVAIKVKSEKSFSQRRKAVRTEAKRKIIGFSKERRTEMDQSEATFEYWKIPFDPLREDIISDHGMCSLPQQDREDVEETSLSKKEVLSDMDYWEIQKILRFIRIGNPTATVLALCALKEIDLHKSSCREIVHRLNGITLFLNILDTNNRRCRVAALKVLVSLASSKKIADVILRKNGMQQLVSILDENDQVVLALACDMLSSLAEYHSARVMAKKLNTIQKLMNVFQNCVKANITDTNTTLCRSVCYASWSCSQSIDEQHVRCLSQSLAVISRLLDSQNEALVVPLLGMVEESATLASFRCELEKERLLDKVILKVKSSDFVIQLLSVKILFKCSGDRKSQKTLLKPENMNQLMGLLKGNLYEISDELLTFLLGILWRCSLVHQHREKFEHHEIFPLLIDVLRSEKSLQAKSTALGVLSEFLREDFYAASVVKYGVVSLLMDFMSSTEPSILVNSTRSLGICACSSLWRGNILQLDGLRLIWSLLKSSSDEVLASGAVAVASVCACPEESAITVRSIVGGIELLMSLLTNTELTKCKVLICLCEAALSIAKDSENRSILTDYGLVPALLRLSTTKNKILRYYVTRLISRCCEAKREKNILSKCIPFLVNGLGGDHDEHVHCASICALNELSRDSTNCVFLRESRTTKALLSLLASSNERIQDAAAGCLANVRKSITVHAAV